MPSSCRCAVLFVPFDMYSYIGMLLILLEICFTSLGFFDQVYLGIPVSYVSVFCFVFP